MSLTVKLTSLIIRTAAKPIGNFIKSRAREHPTFRKQCVALAQQVHRIDMRLRLGLLQDPATIDRQIQREQEAEARKHRSKVATAKTEQESKRDSETAAKDKERIEKEVKQRQENQTKRMIKPLSEAKAIDFGANFISESFLFMVATGLILFETFRSRRKENNRREDVAERLEGLEEEVRRAEDVEQGLKGQIDELQAEIERVKGGKVGWSQDAMARRTRGDDGEDQQDGEQQGKTEGRNSESSGERQKDEQKQEQNKEKNAS